VSVSPAGPATAPARPTTQPWLRGIVPPMVTPLAAADRLDVPGLETLVARLLAGGVHGVFILGTCGEGPALSTAIQREVIRRTTAFVGGRVPVLVGISDAAVAESVSLAGYAADCGADAVVAAAPCYFPASQSELVGWAGDLAARSPLPLVLYNFPQLVKTVIEPESLTRLAAHHSIVGLKDSEGCLRRFAAYAEVVRRERPDWTLLIGPEQLLAEAHAAGGHGGVPGGANILPRLFVELHAALLTGDTARVAELAARVAGLGEVYAISDSPGAVIVGIKEALAALGVCAAATANPFEPLGPAARERLRELMDRLG
jgi:dihydrodipicolinate synthase/N-acetylneuraminate lyase